MTEKQEHSKLPWRVYPESKGRFFVAEDHGPSHKYATAVTGWGCVTQSKANANFIAVACNSFDALVAVARETRAWLMVPDRDGKPTEYTAWPERVAMIDAALSLVEQKEQQ